MTLGPHEYRQLIRATLARAHDADTIAPDPRTLFTPPTHRLALDPDVTVVKGGRGVGKTVWFQALQDPVLREIAAAEYQLPRLTTTEPVVGYGLERAPHRYPTPRILEDLVSRGCRSEDIWYAVLLNVIGVPEVQELTWPERVSWVARNSEGAETALRRADEAARKADKIQLLLFDALEWLHPDRSVTDELVTGILRLALELRLTSRNLRAKVFIRHDMLDNLSLNFSDASKIVSNAAELTWTRTNLYGLLFHYLGNGDDVHAEAFRAATGRWGARDSRDIPPSRLLNDTEQQKAEFTAIAGPYMGPNPRRGHTFTWLPNHLADGVDQVSPRSFLSALDTASERSENQYGGHRYALHWDAIKHGVRKASETRVREITEDIDWVGTVISPLRNEQVPIAQEDVLDCWRTANVREELAARSGSAGSIAAGPRDTSPGQLINELIEIGVMTRRATGKLDLPDIYRIAFGLGRKGGVPRVKRS